jgi:CheY-like chemotaxis protein
MARILLVSYDESLLKTRELILRNRGHKIVPALGYPQALKHCESGEKFDLFILGHSIPHSDKESLIGAFRARCPGPVVALIRYGEQPVQGAHFHIEPKPDELLELVGKLTAYKPKTPD